MRSRQYYSIYIVAFTLAVACREKYTLPARALVNNSFLVVEGYINVGGDSTFIRLSNTTKISDTVKQIMATTGANVTVQSDDGSSYALNEMADGIYAIPAINGSVAAKYRIAITTADGRQYQSDYVPFKATPPIDSISWDQQDDGVHIYANAHDDAANTKYYKWDYVETWAYTAPYDSYLIFVNGAAIGRDPDKHIYRCWRTITSSNISLFTTTKLSADVVYKAEVMFIPTSTQRLGIKYSILLKQHALSEEGFNYWQQLSKNTENLGSIFDAQPSQLTGNIHSTSNPGETVLGFITASSQQQKRIFISREDLRFWHYPPVNSGCDTVHLDTQEKMLLYANQGYIPVDSYTFGKPYATTVDCADCRTQGGTLTKPSFWP